MVWYEFFFFFFLKVQFLNAYHTPFVIIHFQWH